MNTRSCTMAAEDLTGPLVLKVQSSVTFPGKTPSAKPNSAGPPRNMGQLPAQAAEPGTESNKRMQSATLIRQPGKSFDSSALQCIAGSSRPTILIRERFSTLPSQYH